MRQNQLHTIPCDKQANTETNGWNCYSWFDYQKSQIISIFGFGSRRNLLFNEHMECWANHWLSILVSLTKSNIESQIKLVRELYHAFIYSRIKYGIEVCGNWFAKNINTIQVTLNKLLKFILHKDRRTPTHEIHKTMNILKDIYECNALSFLNNITMKMCPRSFELYFQKRQNNFDVRRWCQLVVHVVRLCLSEKAVCVKDASLWNRLHKAMVQYRLMKCFKGKLSKYHMWCIDMWLVVLWYSKPSLWNMIAYCTVPTWKTIVLVVMFDPCCPNYFSIFSVWLSARWASYFPDNHQRMILLCLVRICTLYICLK